MLLIVIKESLNQDKYIESLIEKHLINNPHKLNYSLVPDTEFNKRNEDAIIEKVHQRN